MFLGQVSLSSAGCYRNLSVLTVAIGSQPFSVQEDSVANRNAVQDDQYAQLTYGKGTGRMITRMPHCKTLVVDDGEGFRRFLCSTLMATTECEIVGEASDGLQAVNQAEKLQPDLILLDLGLPTLNGIQAARRIRQLSPNSKILFVSQNSSPEIAEGALKVGALGYLVKSDMTELTSAISTVLTGVQFISSRIKQP
jgi:CheY-like chemotaxis protein